MSKEKQLRNIIELVEKNCQTLHVNLDTDTDYTQIRSSVLLDVINNLESVRCGLSGLTTGDK